MRIGWGLPQSGRARPEAWRKDGPWNYKFTGPILIGDTIRIRVKIASKRETKKPDRGIVVEYVTMVNQRGEVIQEGEHGLMVLRKAGA